MTAADNMLEASIDPSYKSITVEEMKSLEQKLESLVKIYTKRTKVVSAVSIIHPNKHSNHFKGSKSLECRQGEHTKCKGGRRIDGP